MVGTSLMIGGALAAATLAILIPNLLLGDVIQRTGMRFFRDLGRIKARRRLTSNSGNRVALYSDIILGKESPDLPPELRLEENDVIVDIEELRNAVGGFEDDDDDEDGDEDDDDNNAMQRPLWLSILGRVYDVSKNPKFYGPGAKYHVFVGRDASRSFCTGCMKPECLISSLANLTLNQKREADRWVEYYEFHDKYTYVGKLQNVTGSIDDLVEKALKTESEGVFIPPIVPSS